LKCGEHKGRRCKTTANDEQFCQEQVASLHRIY
jgi:hypothetical protein